MKNRNVRLSLSSLINRETKFVHQRAMKSLFITVILISVLLTEDPLPNTDQYWPQYSSILDIV